MTQIKNVTTPIARINIQLIGTEGARINIQLIGTDGEKEVLELSGIWEFATYSEVPREPSTQCMPPPTLDVAVDMQQFLKSIRGNHALQQEFKNGTK